VRPQFYGSLIQAARAAGSHVLLDTSAKALRAGLVARPDFIKPNREEAEALLGRKLRSRGAVADAAHDLIAKGAASAAISLGAEGLVLVERKNGATWLARPPKIRTISTVGCGDATVAGFAIAATSGLAGADAIRLAAACGAANCLAKVPGKVSARDVRMLAPRVRVERLD
jgi:fructose-1-phosphate kinase PfkB-like protein